MPRRGRLCVPGVPHHVTRRGVNGTAVFFSDHDRLRYLRWLKEGLADHECLLHAWVLMGNHVHLLITPPRADSLSHLMKLLGQKHAQAINREQSRTGPLWEGRFHAALVESEPYLIRCMRYVDANPLRAGLVDDLAAWRWSSYGANALARPDPLVTAHSLYESLGATLSERAEAYRDLFKETLDSGFLANLRRATRGDFGLGSDHYLTGLESRHGLQLRPRRNR